MSGVMLASLPAVIMILCSTHTMWLDCRNNNYIRSGQGSSDNDTTDGNRQVCPCSGQASNEAITWNDRFNTGMTKAD